MTGRLYPRRFVSSLDHGAAKSPTSRTALSIAAGLLVVSSVALVACSPGGSSDSSNTPSAGSDASSGSGGSSSSSGGGKNDQSGAGAGAGTSASGGPTSDTTIPVPSSGKPAEAGTTTLTLTDAAALATINYVPNRSSVRLYLPGVSGVHDYRVFAVKDGVKVSADAKGREHVDGADIYCAGLRQRNQCTDDAILPIKYNNTLLDMPKCQQFKLDRRPSIPTQVMQTMEIDGVDETTTLVVEAIDRLCPFPGLFGTVHKDVEIANVDIGAPKEQAVIDGKSVSLKLLPDTFPLRTEAEIRKDYGSMIFNGQAPNQPVLDASAPGYPESPYIRVGAPAPADDPVVLARSVVKVTPLGSASLPAGFTDKDFFDDFQDDTDQPVFVRKTDPANDVLGVGTLIQVYKNKKWIFYDVANEFSDFSINRGHLNMVFGDPYQDSMTLQALYPRALPVHLPTAADKYLHVTYEVQRNETPRRYENFSLCGSDKVGETYNGDTPKAAPKPQPGFMNEDLTAPTSTLGWNCLTLVARGAGYGVLPGGDIAGHSDTSLKITVVRSNPPPPAGKYGDKTLDEYSQAFGPTQEDANPTRWERQVNASGQPSGVWLDDQTNAWQKSRFDVFVRRDRVVIYVEGEQRICQNLDPASMTMAEGAVGLWHVLYHTSAEFTEIRSGLETENPTTAQQHIMHNTPFADWRSYDNVGIQEDISLPADFNAKLCQSGKSSK